MELRNLRSLVILRILESLEIRLARLTAQQEGLGLVAHDCPRIAWIQRKPKWSAVLHCLRKPAWNFESTAPTPRQ